jgi:hypothetical protein
MSIKYLEIILANLRPVAYGFMIFSLVILIGFLISTYLFKIEVWICYLWIPFLALGLEFLGLAIEFNRLGYKIL